MQNAIELPDFLKAELPTLPRNGDRRMLAQIITQHLYPISPRSLEVWPLTWRRVSKKAVASTEEALKHAWRVYDAAPVTRAGQPGNRRLLPLNEGSVADHNDAADERSSSARHRNRR